MSEAFSAHQVVGLNGRSDVLAMDADRHSHDHMLRTFHYLTLNSQQVTPFQGFEAKVVVIEVSCEVDGLVKLFCMGLHKGVDCRIEKRSWSLASILAVVESIGDILDRGTSLLA